MKEKHFNGEKKKKKLNVSSTKKNEGAIPLCISFPWEPFDVKADVKFDVHVM